MNKIGLKAQFFSTEKIFLNRRRVLYWRLVRYAERSTFKVPKLLPIHKHCYGGTMYKMIFWYVATNEYVKENQAKAVVVCHGHKNIIR